MTSDAAIRSAIDLIDQWVHRRPPGAHYQRLYEIPWEQDASSDNAVRIFEDEPQFAALLNHFSDRREHIPGLIPSCEADARKFDGSYFEGMRRELLDQPLKALQSLLTPTLQPDLACRALTAMLYGNVQNLLWKLYVHKSTDLSRKTLAEWGMGAEYALQQLVALRTLSEQDRVDAMIRIQFVRAWCLIFANNLPGAATCILRLAGWYAFAEKQKLEQVTRDRYSDYITALYAMLDYEAQGTACEFTDSAALLLKRLEADAYRVSAAWLSSWTGPKGASANVSQPPFDIPRLVKAQKRLGQNGALVDLVLTDNRLHIRVLSLDDRRHIRDDLAETNRPVPEGESPRGINYLTPSSVALVPVHVPDDEVEFRDLAKMREFRWQDSDEARQLPGGVGPASQVVHWQPIFRRIHVYKEDANWTWKAEWAKIYYEASDDFWQTLYDLIYAKIVPEFEQRGIRHLVISPDGSLTTLPHHLLRDSSGRRLGDKFKVSYSPNLLGLTACLEADLLDVNASGAVLVADPTESVRFAAWECADITSVLGSKARLVGPKDADVDRIRQACSGAGIFHFSGHAVFDWSAPDASYLRVAANEKLGLAEIRSLQFAPGALVFLSACGTARSGHSAERCTPHGIVNAFFEAGAATVIGTLWPVVGAATALVAHWFYRAWLDEGKGRLESLNEATTRLREATRAECEQILSQRLRLRGDKPFADEYYWGAFVLYGAW